MLRVCPECGKLFNQMCNDCGVFYDTPEYTVTDLYNYTAKPKRFYKREDHFKEVLYQLQGKEGKILTTSIIEKIREQVRDPSNTNVHEIKAILRKMKQTKYVENAFYITFAISGEQPPHIKREVEDKLIRMFSRIISAYLTVSAQKRKSFPNYYYIIFKLLELVGHTELLHRIPMLRTKLRLNQHDTIWKQICNELDWAFAPTSFNPNKVLT